MPNTLFFCLVTMFFMCMKRRFSPPKKYAPLKNKSNLFEEYIYFGFFFVLTWLKE